MPNNIWNQQYSNSKEDEEDKKGTGKFHKIGYAMASDF